MKADVKFVFILEKSKIVNFVAHRQWNRNNFPNLYDFNDDWP